MRIENLWKQRLTWELLVLSLPAALLIAFIALTHTPDQRINVSERADRAMGVVAGPAETNMPRRVTADLRRTFLNRFQFRNRMVVSPVVGLAPSASSELDEFGRIVRPIQDEMELAGAATSPPGLDRSGLYAFGQYVASVNLGTQAIRQAGSGNWVTAIETLRRSVDLDAKRAAAMALMGWYWRGTRLSAAVLLGLRPGAADAKVLARIAAAEATQPMWRGSLPANLKMADSVLRSEYGNIATIWFFGDVTSILPAASVGGLAVARERLTTPAGKELANRAQGWFENGRGMNRVSLFLPWTRLPALKAQLRKVARDEPAVRRDLELAHGILGDMDPSLALGYLYFFPARAESIWIGTGQASAGHRQAGMWRLAEAGFAAQVFRAERGRWPETAAEMTPDYLSPEMKVPPRKPGILEDMFTRAGYAPMKVEVGTEPVTTATVLHIYQAVGLVDQGTANAPMVSFEPLPGGKVRVRWMQAQFGGGDALHALYLAEALRRWPAQAETTATVWENLPDGKGRVPLDPGKARAAATAMDKYQESLAPGPNPSARYEGPNFGTLTLEMEAIFPERVFVVKGKTGDPQVTQLEQTMGLPPDPFTRLYP